MIEDRNYLSRQTRSHSVRSVAVHKPLSPVIQVYSASTDGAQGLAGNIDPILFFSINYYTCGCSLI